MGALAWQERAACTEDAETFFRDGAEAAAKRICGRCPVREECLAYALETQQPEGVWGGLNPQERVNHLRLDLAVSLISVTYTTRARSTGAVCSAGRTEDGWGAACEPHGASVAARNRGAAERAVSRPQEWCPTCADIASGSG